MALEWADTIAAGVKQLLLDFLPAQIAEIAAARADGLDPVMPTDDAIWVCDKWLPSTLPSIEIIIGDSTRLGDDESPKRYGHGLQIVASIGGTDEQAIEVQMKRMMLAIMLVVDNALLTAYGVANGTTLRAGSINYDLVQPIEQDSRWVRTGMIAVSTETIL